MFDMNEQGNDMLDALIAGLMRRAAKAAIEAGYYIRLGMKDAVDEIVLDDLKPTCEKVINYTFPVDAVDPEDLDHAKEVAAYDLASVLMQMVDQGVLKLSENGEDIELMDVDIVVVRVIAVTEEELKELIEKQQGYARDEARRRAAEAIGGTLREDGDDDGDIKPTGHGKVDEQTMHDIFAGIKTVRN